MMARSPSARVGPDEGLMVAVQVESSVLVVASSSVTVVGLNMPVRIADVAWGLAPPIEISPPLKDSPSRPNVKYEGPKTLSGPLSKVTVKLRLDRLTGVATTNGSPEFGPVRFDMSNAAVLPGIVMS